jgi:Fic family protein
VDRPEEREILNYVAWNRGMDAWGMPASPEDVLALHRTLFTGVLRDAGEFKDTWNFIGRRPEFEVTFIPAAPERVRPELENALQWLGNADEHPLIRVMVFFHEVQSIHPFRDGNGRTGRALTTLTLHRFGYAGVKYALVDYAFNADRPPYYEHLALVERNDFDYTPWIRYMARVLRDAFEGAVHRFLFRDKLPSGLADRQVDVAEWFARHHRENPRRRVKFNDVHHAFPHVPDRTLKRDLARLRDAGVIEMQGERKAASYRLAA